MVWFGLPLCVREPHPTLRARARAALGAGHAHKEGARTRPSPPAPAGAPPTAPGPTRRPPTRRAGRSLAPGGPARANPRVATAPRETIDEDITRVCDALRAVARDDREREEAEMYRKRLRDAVDLVAPGVVDVDGPPLQEQLQHGLELTSWSRVPTGSGLGTSSIFAACAVAVLRDADWSMPRTSRRHQSERRLP